MINYLNLTLAPLHARGTVAPYHIKVCVLDHCFTHHSTSLLSFR